MYNLVMRFFALLMSFIIIWAAVKRLVKKLGD